MMRRFWLAVVLWIAVFVNSRLAQSQDFLDSLLASVGWTRDSLGFAAQARWTRMPDPERLPFVLPFFTSLWRYPLSIYEFAKSFSTAAKQYLRGEYRQKQTDGLYRAFYFLAVDRWVTGFRPYSANIVTTYDPSFSLESALRRLWRLAGRLPHRPPFGGQYVATSEPWSEFVQAVDSLLPVSAQQQLALLLHNLVDVLAWYQTATRNISTATLARVIRIRDLHTTQGDGNVFYPEIEDAFVALDRHSLLYAASKGVAALELFVRRMENLRLVQNFALQLVTPFGEIVLTGSGADTIVVAHPLLVVDFGGNDQYHGQVAGAMALQNPVSLLVDLGGDDRYFCREGVSQGAAICGIGILWDHQGDDRYEGEDITQGSAQLGVGMLVDESGNDEYRAGEVAQGAGFLGIGLLFELGGNDRYRLLGNGQGDGEFGGIGVLADVHGEDWYYAEPWAAVYDRGDYHSDYKVNLSNAQGFGGGRRGDGSDGHSWAGGLGVLLDLAGNDRYVSGNWSLGTGYWFGVGLLIDEGGDDHYRSCYFTQASGAHFAIGAMIDEQGNDRYELFETMGAALAFGWDFTVAFFLDRQGNDWYRVRKISLGVAQVRSQAFFFELDGDDRYFFGDTVNVLGTATPYRYAQQYSPLAPYFYWSRSIALFADLGGEDEYQPLMGMRSARVRFRNNAIWYAPRPQRRQGFAPAANCGIGVDRHGGAVREFLLRQLLHQQ